MHEHPMSRTRGSLVWVCMQNLGSLLAWYHPYRCGGHSFVPEFSCQFPERKLRVSGALVEMP